jgi:predicted nucleotidyltransferase
MSSWVRYRFQHLRRWREYAEKIAKAVKDLLPDTQVYVIGSVAEGNTTVYSDIDILVVVPAKALSTEEKKQLLIQILERAIDLYQLPWDAPVEIHIADKMDITQYQNKCKVMIPV